jgi:hypothetical protein
MYTFTFMSFFSKVNCPPHKNNILEPKHSFPLDDPFCPYKVFGVLEVFNEALSIFVYNLLLLRFKLPDPLSCIRDRSQYTPYAKAWGPGLNKGGDTVRPSGARPSQD